MHLVRRRGRSKLPRAKPAVHAGVPRMTTAPVNEPRPVRVLFLCTGNSARSQRAEALLHHKGNGRFHAASAGSHPAARVHPYAIAALRHAGIVWAGHEPRPIDGLEHERWDIVITICDRAKEACPYLPGQPILAHWGMEDPADVEGPDAAKVRALDVALLTLARRIDLLVALPIDTLDRSAMDGRVRAIGAELPTAPAARQSPVSRFHRLRRSLALRGRSVHCYACSTRCSTGIGNQHRPSALKIRAQVANPGSAPHCPSRVPHAHRRHYRYPWKPPRAAGGARGHGGSLTRHHRQPGRLRIRPT